MNNHLKSFPLFFLVLVVLIISGSLAGCSEQAASLPEGEEPVGEVQITPVQPTPTDADAAEEQPQEVDLIKAEDEVNQCLECHTDREALIDNAAPQVTIEEESSGEG